jgi:steroid delta-isomerase-like uncharacterized protein
MSVEEHKALVQRLVDLWNTGDLAGFDACLAADYANRDPHNPETTDRASYTRWAATLRAAFPDLRVTAESMIGEGDRVAKAWTCTGTHRGEYLGVAPTGRRTTWRGVTLYRFAGGKVAECIWYADALGLLQQLGVTSLPAAPAAVGAAR